MIEPDFVHATRSSYDAIADGYTAQYGTGLFEKGLDRAMLAAFAGCVREAGGGPVADVGCGPGRATSHLDSLGLSVSGIDLSPRMLALAREAHPGLRFTEGSMLDLDLADGSLAGLVAWYSIIHVPGERLPDVFAEFHRVLAPGGHALVAFQVGDEPAHYAEGFGHAISLTFHRLRPDRIAELLTRAGLPVTARLQRERADDGPHAEKTPQAFLLARRPEHASS